jgi:exoribonuclease R
MRRRLPPNATTSAGDSGGGLRSSSSSSSRRSRSSDVRREKNDDDMDVDRRSLSSSRSSTTEEGGGGGGGGGSGDGLSSPTLLDVAVEYLAGLIARRLRLRRDAVADAPPPLPPPPPPAAITPAASDDTRDDATVDPRALARGRFVDLATTIEGERILEELFLPSPDHHHGSNDEEDGDDDGLLPPHPTDVRVVRLAITTLQSLLVHGMQIGVKGSDEMQLKAVRHLFRVDDVDGHPPPASSSSSSSSLSSYPWADAWDTECVRRLKFRRDAHLGKALLAKMKRNQKPRGAFDLLVELGAWDVHEDTSLLRSGFPTRFSEDEIRASTMAESASGERDPDEILGMRKDLRHFKVYTIDGESTSDIDDGISVEVLGGGVGGGGGADGTSSARHRYWIHIADVDRWAPRGSELLGVAERRGTSLYLPAMTLCMFPEK